MPIPTRQRLFLLLFLITALVAAVWVGIVDYSVQRHEQKVAARIIEENGEPGFTSPAPDWWPRWLQDRMPFRRLTWVSLDWHQIDWLPGECCKPIPSDLLADVATLSHLETLLLSGRNIQDADLVSLSSLARLKRLELGRTGTTPKARQSLRQALPDCVIGPNP